MSKPTSFDTPTDAPPGAESVPGKGRKTPRDKRARARREAGETPAQARPGAAETAKTAPAQEKPAPPDKDRPGPVPPPAGPARRKRRHIGLALAFLLVVVAPAALATGYLYTRAADQYASRVGFAVRTEETSSASELLGGITQISSASSKDTDILYEFIQSQQLVKTLQDKLDLRAIYSKPHAQDPVFAFAPGASLEELVDYWGRMVKIFYDSSTGLLRLRVLAFTPEDAQTIAEAIFDESSRVINDLSAVARRDATRYARDDLDTAKTELREARAALTEFRNRNQIVDPKANIQGQMGLLNSLQQKLATARVELQLLRDSAGETDPRIRQGERRIEVIEDQIAEERKKFSLGGSAGGEGENDYVEVLGEYERLNVDREFAREAYVAARSAYDSARAEADRQTRYLAAFIEPTKAETSRYPRRLTLAGLATLFLALAWAIGALVFYSLRDRR